MAAQAEVGLVLRQLHGLVAAETADSLGDQQLLERFVQTRTEEAFAALVRRHGGMVLGVCRRVLGHYQDAEDCFQAAFLILARKAASIRRHASLGSWLYGVAYRLALKARASAARRRDRESQRAALPSTDPTAEITGQELRVLLDEELQKLPDSYRAAVVLCYLEGKTQDQAARQLDWSKGTLRRRLRQGRELLCQRLQRRGVAPALALAATLTAVVPTELVASTARAALRFAAGTVGSAPLPRAAALAEGGLKTLFVGKLKSVAALLLAVSIAAAAAVGAAQFAAPPTSAPDKPAPGHRTQRPADAKQEPADTIEVSGRVLDPTGKPLAGAKVYYFRSNLFHLGDGGVSQGKQHGKPTEATSGPDGRFRFHVKKMKPPLEYRGSSDFEATVAAVAPGHGPGFQWVGRTDGLKDLQLKLVKDNVPLRGRVLDLQGKPIQGVRVRVLAVIAGEAEDLTPLVAALPQSKDASLFWRFLSKSFDPAVVRLPHLATTDVHGRFQLSGCGRERVLALRFEGPGVETQVEYVLTRPGPATRILRGRDQPGGAERLVIHGAVFERVAAPSRLILGTVRDRSTGQPLAGVVVAGMAHGSGTNTVRTTTDSKGRYRLEGLPQNGRHSIHVSPATGQPHLPSSAETAVRSGFEPLRLDFGLTRGVLIRGKVTDRSTNKPVLARVHYFAFADNPNLGEAPGFRGSGEHSSLTRPDGSFTLVGLPGRGLLAASAVGAAENHYLGGVGAKRIKGARNSSFSTAPYYCSAERFNTLAEINPARGVREASCDVTLDPGKAAKGRIIGPDGKPVKGVRIEGFAGLSLAVRVGPLSDSRFTLPNIDPNNSRPFFFYHDGKKLGAAVLLKGGEVKDAVVRLQPLATLTGRLLDADGRPVVGVSLAGFLEAGQLNLDTPWGGLFSAPLDKQGRFHVVVLPGVRMGARLVKGTFVTDSPLKNLTLRPGEVKGLGDVTIKTNP